MSAWTSSELSGIDATDEVELAISGPDGSASLVTVWVVQHGADVYVRSVRGRQSRWFRGADVAHEGHLRAGRLDRRVTFVEVDDANDVIDQAYEAKYGRRYPNIVPSIVAPAARSATLKLVPRN